LLEYLKTPGQEGKVREDLQRRGPNFQILYIF
jgi:hypothetical protein